MVDLLPRKMVKATGFFNLPKNGVQAKPETARTLEEQALNSGKVLPNYSGEKWPESLVFIFYFVVATFLSISPLLYSMRLSFLQ
jgi:hypothetical protein